MSSACWRLNFKMFEPISHSSRWVKKKSSFFYLLWALDSIYCQSTKDPLGSSFSDWIEFWEFFTSLTLKSLSLEASNQAKRVSSGINTTSTNKSVVEFSLLIFQDVWTSLTLKLLSVRSVNSRYVSSGSSTASLSVVELIHSYNVSVIPSSHLSRLLHNVSL